MSSTAQPGRRRLAKVLAGASVVALGALSAGVIAAAPASASETVSAQLSLTGISDAKNPTGGSVLGIHPGDSLTLTPSVASTSALDTLGLGSILGPVNGLLSGLTGFSVTANFTGLPGASSLPGGGKAVVLGGLGNPASQTFTFAKAGTYDFTFQPTGLLNGAAKLDASQLAQLTGKAIDVTAKFVYTAKIVVATNPPKGGIGVQLPGTTVGGSVAGVKLPTITLPGVSVSVPVSVPDLSGLTGGGKKSTTTTKPGGTTTAGGSGTTKPVSVIPVPALVMPRGASSGADSSSFNFTPLSGGSSSLPGQLSFANSSFGTPALSKTTAKAPTLNSTGKNKDVALAASRPASTSGMPVILAVVAMLALVLVAGTYARLFLLRKPPAA